MQSVLATPEALTRLCVDTKPSDGIGKLLGQINVMMPGMSFRHVLSRGGWHRLGGVVDKDYQPVARNILHWVEEQCDGDVDELIASYDDAGYFATRLAGKTHFFTVARSAVPQDFVQIEIEELQEKLDRPLIAPDWLPDSVEEFLEPLDYPRLEPEPVGKAYYQFRRITPITQLISAGRGGSRGMHDLKRFFSDWFDSSAGDHAAFCDHWVLSLREYLNREGDPQLTAKPVPTFADEIPELPKGQRVRGADLANAVHNYDRQLGYPFAWYFMMLTSKACNYSLAESVLADQMGAYDYLPGKDLKVLRDWEKQPYGV